MQLRIFFFFLQIITYGLNKNNKYNCFLSFALSPEPFCSKKLANLKCDLAMQIPAGPLCIYYQL